MRNRSGRSSRTLSLQDVVWRNASHLRQLPVGGISEEIFHPSFLSIFGEVRINNIMGLPQGTTNRHSAISIDFLVALPVYV